MIVNNYGRSKKCIVLRYVSGVYERVSSCLKKYSIDTVSKIKKNLSNIIVKGKDRTFKREKNNVVYKVNCSQCGYSYVGQSKRSFDIRKGEHQKQKGSVVYQHINDNRHQFDWKNFKLLHTERNYTKRDISEMLFMKTQNKALNKQEDTVKLNNMYTNTLHHLKSSLP